MAYTKTTWVNNQAPAINAENLNKIEDGIYNSVRYADAQTLTNEQKAQARANIAAAPDGFGLGSAIVYAPENSDGTSDANLIDATGFYLAFANAGSSGWNYVFHMQYPSDAALQFSSYVNDTTYRIRKKLFGVWQPWEWVNPPMQLGVEYRTTERYLGKPVYVRTVDFGDVPNATTKRVGAFPDYRIVDHIVGYTAEMITSGNRFSLPIIDDTPIDQAYCLLTLDGFSIKTTDDHYSNYSATAKFTVKYTKTTD